MLTPRGKLTASAPLAPLVWFKAGGAADWLFEPADVDDLRSFLAGLPPGVPVMALGLGSNLIVRDGGVAGVVVRLGKAFGKVGADGDTLSCGGGASGIAVSSAARDAGVAGLEFLRGIPGTVGGFVRMNGGAYGREVADVLVDVTIVTRDGGIETRALSALDCSYRHSNLKDGEIVVAARLKGAPGDKAAIQAEMDRIAAAREASQPLRTRTGGSTFKNPAPHKAWELVHNAGCRGLRVGGAEVSEKHANFLINSHRASAADIEALGELVRAQVLRTQGVVLEWEIQRVGRVQEEPSDSLKSPSPGPSLEEGRGAEKGSPLLAREGPGEGASAASLKHGAEGASAASLKQGAEGASAASLTLGGHP